MKSETDFEYIKAVISNLSTSTNIKEKLPCPLQEKSDSKPQTETEGKSKEEIKTEVVKSPNVNEAAKPEIKE